MPEVCDIIGCHSQPAWVLPDDDSGGVTGPLCRALCELHYQQLLHDKLNAALRYVPLPASTAPVREAEQGA